jgi:hypothetical protein
MKTRFRIGDGRGSQHNIDTLASITTYFPNISNGIRVLCLSHIKPETLVGIRGEVRLWPDPLLRLSARRRFPTRGRVRVDRLSIGSESDGVEGLQQADEHKRCFVVGELETAMCLDHFTMTNMQAYLLSETNARS